MMAGLASGLRHTLLVLTLVGSLSAGLVGCASAPAASGPAGAAQAAPNEHPADPWEALNRKVFAFNDALDNAVLKPLATAYAKVVPELVRQGVDNVLSNIGDIWSAANQVLQGKFADGLTMGMRVATNSFFGLGGLLDPASEMQGLGRKSEDFGQTLGVWGFAPGPYVVLPLFGSRTVRDSFGMLVDMQFEPNQLPTTEGDRHAVSALALLNTRANLLSLTATLNQVALDRYSFVRDAYLARRRDAIHDGNPPLEAMEDDDPEAPPKKDARPGAAAQPAAHK